jgi:hypothetical protein
VPGRRWHEETIVIEIIGARTSERRPGTQRRGRLLMPAGSDVAAAGDDAQRLTSAVADIFTAADRRG